MNLDNVEFLQIVKGGFWGVFMSSLMIIPVSSAVIITVSLCLFCVCLTSRKLYLGFKKLCRMQQNHCVEFIFLPY
jgi:hypothetical protein